MEISLERFLELGSFLSIFTKGIPRWFEKLLPALSISNHIFVCALLLLISFCENLHPPRNISILCLFLMIMNINEFADPVL